MFGDRKSNANPHFETSSVFHCNHPRLPIPVLQGGGISEHGVNHIIWIQLIINQQVNIYYLCSVIYQMWKNIQSLFTRYAVLQRSSASAPLSQLSRFQLNRTVSNNVGLLKALLIYEV